jgi:hypothetical protein
MQEILNDASTWGVQAENIKANFKEINAAFSNPYDMLQSFDLIIDNDGIWTSNPGAKFAVIPIQENDVVEITSTYIYYTQLSEMSIPVIGGNASLVSGFTGRVFATDYVLTRGLAGIKYIYVIVGPTAELTPTSIKVNGAERITNSWITAEFKKIFDLTTENNKKIAFLSEYVTSDIKINFGIRRQTGVYEGSFGSPIYKAIELHLKTGRYAIRSAVNGSSSNEMLWQYTDGTYSVPLKRIVGNVTNRFEGIVDLEEGYYVFSFNDGLAETIEEGTFIINMTSLSQSQSIINKKFGAKDIGITALTIVNAGFALDVDKLSSLKTGIANRAEYNVNTFENEGEYCAVIEPTTTLFEAGVGKFHAWGSSTLVSIGKDAEGMFVQVYTSNDGATITSRLKEAVTGLNFGINCPISVRFEKVTTDIVYYNITVTDKHGNVYETSTESLCSVQPFTNYAWGKFCVFVLTGTCDVASVHYGVKKDANNVKALIIGHSLVEGSTLYTNMTKRYAALIQTELGVNHCAICGQGGAKLTDLISAIPVYLNWYNSARYVIIEIGENELGEAGADLVMWADSINAQIISKGIVPIWLTLHPNYPSGVDFPLFDAHIRANYNYVDIDPAFKNFDGSLNPDCYLDDNVHPSILGHQKMFDLIRSKAPEIFNV